MRKYVVKRVVSVIPVLFLITILIFSLSYFSKGDASSYTLGADASVNEIINYQDAVKEKGFISSYFTFLFNFIKGDWGYSIINNQSVSRIIFSRLPLTIVLTLFSLLISLLIAVPLSINSVNNQNTIKEERNDIISILLMSLPSFVLALILFIIFTLWLKWFSSSTYVSFILNPIKHIKSLILPSLSQGIMHSALIYRTLKELLAKTLKEDYIRTAKAKGISNVRLLFPHSVKNILVSLIAVLSETAIALFVGGAVVEFIFSIPGIGSLIYNSVVRRDIATLRSIVTLVAIFNVFLHLITDILYTVIDKRIAIIDEVSHED